ncbi:uncharacterized protein EURHEDRAFT_417968 [Aspergillus ruber CBS 135680]|uniref:Uncharacterized protein n=1 Tax=Aspergillus ruber (strain CBS 135680) TaxID=1388766 RepID=A0A017RZA1_ASPRC|nr:uncharacterized protein EURHEDRAFT_417968 [Aspergillus ruber CBS 135680]EYE89916.1 hypothetical protein EURHEDRAFT_417968 [Aspergillus ruber CBS 135680]
MCSTEVKPTSIKDNYYSVGWKSPIILNKYLSPDWWTDSGGYLHSNGEIFLKTIKHESKPQLWKTLVGQI